MRRFVALFEALDQTQSTSGKTAALADYFRTAPADDAAWALTFLTGRRLKRHLPYGLLAQWAAELTGVTDWLIGECWGEVGDLAELVALLLDTAGLLRPSTPGELSLTAWVEQRILPLKELDEPAQRAQLLSWWRELDFSGVLVLNKLLTGEFRVGAAETLVLRAIAQVAELPPDVVAHRMMGTWSPTADAFRTLVAPQTAESSRSQPYPFYLASPLQDPIETLGDPSAWLVEWKWDGIRAQVIHRGDEVHIWSRGEERIGDRFPEIREAARLLPEGTVIDGEILAWRGDKPLPFSTLQRRIGRVELTPEILADAPAVLMAFDLLEDGGVDQRERPLRQRRARLAELLQGRPPALQLSATLTGSWTELAAQREGARSLGVEGLMLKALDGPYRAGRKRGEWWKWKIAPFTLDAVLIYAQPGSGRRASLLTDYTFGIWKEGALVPIAKAYSGLSDAEIAELDAWLRAHTREKHGPVRVVDPELVFELAFEGIALSSRHKSGIAVRFPRILRQRLDKKPADADTLERVQELLALHGSSDRDG
ncbi:MAG: ATP-dependent DNA ligase [Deltaproteobacteria bacterium]|nr:ATP-dependent DNA ligase [Deltaproteobacteria bacterium]